MSNQRYHRRPNRRCWTVYLFCNNHELYKILLIRLGPSLFVAAQQQQKIHIIANTSINTEWTNGTKHGTAPEHKIYFKDHIWLIPYPCAVPWISIYTDSSSALWKLLWSAAHLCRRFLVWCDVCHQSWPKSSIVDEFATINVWVIVSNHN